MTLMIMMMIMDGIRINNMDVTQHNAFKAINEVLAPWEFGIYVMENEDLEICDSEFRRLRMFIVPCVIFDNFGFVPLMQCLRQQFEAKRANNQTILEDLEFCATIYNMLNHELPILLRKYRIKEQLS
jgi:hypothetical protein